MRAQARLKRLLGKPRTARQIAERLGVCKLSVYRWIKKLEDEEGLLLATRKVRDGKTGPRATAYELI